jgi:hypothetical protein
MQRPWIPVPLSGLFEGLGTGFLFLEGHWQGVPDLYFISWFMCIALGHGESPGRTW